MRKSTLAIVLAAAGGIGLGGLATAERGGVPQDGGGPDMGTMLMKGLLNTPGCLGVDTGEFRSGKSAFIAWFEDKAAVVHWYDSRAHERAMSMALGADAEGHDHTPLEHVADDVPIMVIASITFSEQPEVDGLSMPISQIAIELYTPLAGGAHLNGRLAPPAFKVEHMKGYTAPAAEAVPVGK